MRRINSFGGVGVAALVSLLLVVPAPAQDEKYEVRLTRPDAVGDKFKLSGEGALIRKTVMTLGDNRREQEPSGSGIRLDATAEVLAVTPKGKITKLSLAVERCLRVSGPEEAELLPKGSVVIAQADGKRTKFSLKEGELPPEASELLDLLFQLNDDDSRGTDDELFGTKEKQPVGASWPINAEQAAKDFAAEEIKVDASDITGTVKLDTVEKAEGGALLKLSGRMSVKKIQPGGEVAGELPEGLKMDVGSLDFKFTATLPKDPSDHAADESMSARHQIAYVGDLPGGKSVRTEVTVERAVQMKRTPVK